MLNGLNGSRSINEFVKNKINGFAKEEKNFKTLFKYMFLQKENVMAEYLTGYKMNKVTYGEAEQNVYSYCEKLNSLLHNCKKGETVGIYLENGVEWIYTFWAVLMCGFNPLLLNSKLALEQLNKVLTDYSVCAVITKDKTFSVPTFDLQKVIEQENLPLTKEVWGEEVLFMSSGTSAEIKVCCYTAESFFYQLCDSEKILKECPQIRKGYKRELKLLALLPFYHVFGFIAVYLWFGFFARTFVFLKDLSPQTLLNTVKKHKVTHIFAVPMVWNKIYAQAKKTIRLRGESTYNKFVKALNLCNNNAFFQKVLSKKAFKEVREGIFGDSVRFIISGGSNIEPEVLKFFNGIGYFTVNGYGMTEIGITSVETSLKSKIRNKASIGKPFNSTEYKISETGELLVKSKCRAVKIMQGANIERCNLNDWFATKDIAEVKKGRYYLCGRKDDLIVSLSGENINPELTEKLVKSEDAEDCCLIKGNNGEPVLIVFIDGWRPSKKIAEIKEETLFKIKQANLEKEIKKIIITKDKLLQGEEFKVSRVKLSKRFINGEISVCDCKEKTESAELSDLEMQICNLVREIIEDPLCEITPESNFFTDLGGCSLDYFDFINALSEKFNTELSDSQKKELCTVKDFANAVMEANK